MNRTTLALVLLLVVVSAGAIALVTTRMAQYEVPLPVLSRLDPLTARDLAVLRERVRPAVGADWFDLGEAYTAHGFFPEAELCFRRAGELLSDEAQRPGRLTFMHAICLERLGRTAEAVERYREAAADRELGLAPHCWYYIGRNYLREHNTVDAELAFATAGRFAPAKYELAKLLGRDGRAEEARRLLGEVLADVPRAVEPSLLMSRLLQAEGDEQGFLEYRLRAEMADESVTLTANQPWEDAFASLRGRFGAGRVRSEAALFSQFGQVEAALAAFRELGDAPYYDGFALSGAELLLQLGRADEAIDALARFGEVSGHTPESLLLLGHAHSLAGRQADAEQSWERAARIGFNPRVHERLAELKRRLGDAEAAQRHAALAHLGDGLAAFRVGDLPTARSELEQAADLAPDHARTWYYLGELRRLEGERGPALEAYRRAAELDPRDGRAADALRRADQPS